MENKKHNQLIDSLSPYLKQHAYNPVDWEEWGEKAFARAEAENKLIIVSIGYSACHWCHVMAHECFEDEDTAAIMNTHFVCIKIDREELPDIDQIYMDACQLINGSGGWPLNAITLPDKRPIHALTYAPKDQWKNILLSLQELWQKDKKSGFEYAEKISHGIRQMSLPPEMNSRTDQTENISINVFNTFLTQFDEVYGGNNRAPKFPMPSNWRFLLQYGRLMNDEKAKSMALFTLKQMALGGIYDHVQGGFARYSVDGKWFAPHFEKMLYDNAQLISLYSYAFAVSGDEFFKNVVEKTIQFCKSEWLGEDGLYRSALDADSEGVEGLYYTFTMDELDQILGNDSDLFSWYYQCRKEGNWEHGRNILYAIDTLEKAASSRGIEPEIFETTIQNSLEKILQNRNTRIKPGLDDKCIASWNNLMLKAISEAAIWLEDATLIEEAEKLAEAILSGFFKHGILNRIAKNGENKISGFLEDYATLIDALMSLYQCSPDENYLIKAKEFTEETIANFYREEFGFFAFNAKNSLITEKFDNTDDVINSGNSLMAHNLWKLYWYFDKDEWKNMLDTMMSAMHTPIQKSGPWYSHWAALQLNLEQGCAQYVLSAKNNLKNNFPLSDYSAEPNAIFGYLGATTNIPLFKGKEYKGKDLIYPCRDMVCGLGVEI